jgi:O-antigen ligase
MPWLVAVFMFMVYMIPFDSTILPFKLPFTAGLDRLVLIAIALVWAIILLASDRPPRFSHSAINAAVWLFVLLTALSLALNLRDLAWDKELSLSFKQLLLCFTYLIFFYVAATSITREDVTGFCKLLVWLGTACALGTILEYRSHVDVFADLAKLIPGARLHIPHLRAHLRPGARLSFGGPTKHGLADATMLDAAVPIAAVFLLRAREAWHRIGWGAALIALMAGCVATQEKTALILLFVSLAAIVAYHPGRYKRWWPLLIVAVVLIRIASPHSISELIYQFKDITHSDSTSGRTTDYPAVAPFLNTHLLFGRGFGSYEPHKYRILDDQMLGFLIEIGAFGLLAYAGLMLTPFAMCFRRGRRGVTLEDDLLAALSTGFLAFFVSNFLYDSFSFRQGPYTFFFLAALVAAALGTRRPQATVGDGVSGRSGVPARPA